MAHDFDRPFSDVSTMGSFIAKSNQIAQRFGRYIKAIEISNREYRHRFNRFAKQNNMKTPPSSVIHIMSGYLVVRRLGTSRQYETWMPDNVFQELYAVVADSPKAKRIV